MGESGTVFGFQGVLYYNSASWGSPTWVRCPHVRDFKMPLTMDEVEASIRGNGGGFKTTEGGLKDCPVDFPMLYRKSSGALPADVDVFLDRWVNRDTIDLKILDDEEDVTGARGIRGEFSVLKCERDEPLGGAMVLNVSIKLNSLLHEAEMIEVT